MSNGSCTEPKQVEERLRSDVGCRVFSFAPLQREPEVSRGRHHTGVQNLLLRGLRSELAGLFGST